MNRLIEIKKIDYIINNFFEIYSIVNLTYKDFNDIVLVY